MSREQFDDNCKGCVPAMIDARTGRPEPDDSPIMQNVMRFWATTSVEQRRAFHAFTCQNSRDPDVMAIINVLMRDMQEAVESAMTKKATS